MKLISEQKLVQQRLTQYRELREVLLTVMRKKLEMLPFLVVQIEDSFSVEPTEEIKLIMEQFEQYDQALRNQLGIETLYSGQPIV